MRKFLIITIIAVCAAVIVLFYAVDPGGSVWMPKCLFKLTTGFDCPGCGSGRALHHLLHGRFGQAVRFNPIAVVATPYALTLIWLQYLGGKRRFARLHNTLTGRRAVWIVVGTILVYWVARNLFL